MKSKEFIRLNLIYVLYIIGVFLSWNIIAIYFFKQGFNFVEISFYYLLFSLASMLFLLYPHGLNVRTAIKYSQALRIVSFVLVFYFFSKIQLYLTAIVLGIALELFWIPYNFKLKEYESQDSKKLHIRNLMRLGSILKVVVPAIGGLIASRIGFFPLFLTSIFLFLLNIESCSILSDLKIKCDIVRAIITTKGVKLLFFLEGLWQTIPFIIVPLISLRYVSVSLQEQSQVFFYGLFFSFIALLSVVAYHLTRRMEKQDKKHILYPLTTMLAILTIVTGYVKNMQLWITMVGLTVLTWKIAEHFTDSLMQSKNTENLVVLRRFFIAMGRVIGTSIGILVLYFYGATNLEISMRIIGAIFLLYPIVLFLKK
jgi:hypothetical protein